VAPDSAPGAARAPLTEDVLLRWAAAAEQLSEHPLGRAIVAEAQQRRLPLAPVQASRILPGTGVHACIEGRQVYVGRPGRAETGEALEAHGAHALQRLEQEGKTVLVVRLNGSAAGLLGLRDTVRPGVPAAIAAIRRTGVRRVLLMTGDNARAASAVAAEIGVDEVHAGLLPEDKLALVRDLQRQGLRVAVVGDGVNDAPALAAADVGIAMATGTDVAIHSAAVTILHGDPNGIVRALRLSRATMRNVRQNLFWAFVYNLLAVPVAAGALYPVFGVLLSPMLASAAMSFSSVSVIANALRLRRARL
jgi:Cu+-exporting ATPase